MPGFTSRLFISGSLAFVLIGVLGAAYGVSLPAFQRNFGLAEGGASLILSVQALGAMLAVLAAVMGLPGLTGRAALALIALGAAGVALGPTWPLVLAGGFVAGAGFGLIAVFVNRDFLRGFGTRGPGMVGLVNAISGLGLIAGPLLYVMLGGQTLFLFGAIALFAAAILFVERPGEGAPGPRGLPNLWQPKMAILLLNLVTGMIETTLGGLGVTSLIAQGWSEVGAARLNSGFFAAFLLARLALYWLSPWLGAERLFLIAALGTAAAAAVAAAGWSGTGHVLAGGFIGLAFPSFFVWGARVLGDDPRLSAAMLLSGLTGGALGPLVFGGLLAILGMEHLYLLVAIVAALLGVVVAAVLSRQLRQMA